MSVERMLSVCDVEKARGGVVKGVILSPNKFQVFTTVRINN